MKAAASFCTPAQLQEDLDSGLWAIDSISKLMLGWEWQWGNNNRKNSYSFLGRLHTGNEANKGWQQFTQAVISLFLQNVSTDKEKLLINGSRKIPPAQFVTVAEKQQLNQVELLLFWGRKMPQDKLYSSPVFCTDNSEDLQKILKVHSGKLRVYAECVKFHNERQEETETLCDRMNAK